jgi:hypothetical protein
VATNLPHRAMVAQPLQGANAAYAPDVNYCECPAVCQTCLDMSDFGAGRRPPTGRHQNPTVGYDKPDTGHCSLKQCLAHGIVGRFAASQDALPPPTCRPRLVLATTIATADWGRGRPVFLRRLPEAVTRLRSVGELATGVVLQSTCQT